jgi:Fe-S cluster assembly protein SufD
MTILKELFESKAKELLEKNVSQTQKNAALSFLKMGIPTIKHEDWKYSNLSKVANLSVDSLKSISGAQVNSGPLLDFGKYKLVFINGHYKSDLSVLPASEVLYISELSAFKAEQTNSLNAKLGSLTDNNTEALSALNTALSETGVVIKIKANKTFEEPIVIQNIIDSRSSSQVVNLKNLIVADPNSEAKIVEIFYSTGSDLCFENVVTEIEVQEDARLDYYKIQQQSNATYHVGTTQVLQHKKSYFYAGTISLSGLFIRNNLNIVLDGEYIESHMYGLYIPTGNEHIDNHSLVDHTKPNCESNELYKGILSDKSTGVFNGKIFVRQDAQKTNAYQNCRNVITSDSATMNTKPQLEIWADDVKCSHGTTTGKLNQDHIFYMQSRGIPKSEAVKLQLVAFAEDVVSQIKIEELRNILDALIEEKLNWTEQ